MRGLVEVFMAIAIRVFVPIIIVLLILISIKIFTDYLKYGKKIFRVKTKYDDDTYKKILYESLIKIKWPKKILDLPYLNADYVLIDSNGITLFKVFTKVGRFIPGEDGYLYYFDGKEKRTQNPMALLEKDKKLLQSKVNIDIKCYIIPIDTAFITGVDQIKLRTIPYKLPKGIDINLDDLEKEVSKSV